MSLHKFILSDRRRAVLEILVRNNGERWHRDLQADTGLPSPVLSQALSRMASAGYILLRPVISNGRTYKVVVLTPRGKQGLEAHTAAVAAIMAEPDEQSPEYPTAA